MTARISADKELRHEKPGHAPGKASIPGRRILGALVSRPHFFRALRPRAGGTQAFAERAVPGTPFPRKRPRGVKSAEMPLEPIPNHGTTPSP